MRNVRIAFFIALLSWTTAVCLVDPAAASAGGDEGSPARVCEQRFSGAGAFDAAAAFAACRRAAALGDAAAIRRLGFLYLAGVGTERDLDQAAGLCGQKQSQDDAAPGGFCLAAVAEERLRGGLPSGTETPLRPPPADDALAAALTRWRDLATQGDRAATAHLCKAYFDAPVGAFRAAEAAEWCRRASRDGNAAAMRRLGLMRLWGVGMDRSVPQAETLCREAQAGDPAAAFCVAAIGEQRRLAAGATGPSHFARTPEQPPSIDALALDRVLESVHQTKTGLQFSCRDILKWSRYETAEGMEVITATTRAFGRPILSFAPPDYAALDQAAAECAAKIAAYDSDGSTRRHFAEFRKMLPLIEARQRDLKRQSVAGNDDVQRCVEALRRSRAAAERLAPVAGQTDPLAADIFSCTTAGSASPVGIGARSVIK
jgi:hypothetical protein